METETKSLMNTEIQKIEIERQKIFTEEIEIWNVI